MNILYDALPVTDLSRWQRMYIESKVHDGSLAHLLLVSDRGDYELSRLSLE